jgi:hypothetical protein
MTIARTEFTKDMARIMGDGRNSNRVLICHGLDNLRQLALHSLLRPNYSLMDVCGVIPEDYLWGEIILPMFLPMNKIFASLVVWQGAKWGTYNPELYKSEIGHCNLMCPPIMRVTVTLPRTRLPVLLTISIN